VSEVHTYCRLCEGICGLKLEVQDGEITSVQPDREHPLSRGFVCLKGMNSTDVLYHRNRVLHPRQKVGSAWEQRSWEAAFSDIGDRLRGIRDKHGPDAIALYIGNPSAMSAVTAYVAGAFLRSIGSTRRFSAMSLDNINKFWVAEEMFGDKSFILQRDWERARYMLVFGHNPRISIFGQLSTRPRGGEEVRTARAAGAHFVLVDPRRTESVGMADEHLQITPGTDVYFLLSLLNVIVTEERYSRRFVDAHCTGWDGLAGAVAPFTPEITSGATGIDADVTRRIARDFASADGAFAFGATGVTQQRYCTATEWAIEALNVITGNIDRPGGAFFNPGVVDDPRPKKTIERDRPSRIGGYARILGEYPMSTFADEVLTAGDKQIRALIVTAGNPLATGPDLSKLKKAFGQLELLVVIDLFMSTTAQAADWVLPATTFFERSDINIPFTRHMQFPYVQYTERIVKPRGEAREEWEIFRGLHKAMGTAFLNDPRLPEGYTPDEFFRDFLGARGAVKLEELKQHPHGMKLGEKPIGAFLEQLKKRGLRINLFPASVAEGLPGSSAVRAANSAEFPILMISRRNLRSICSWYHVGDDDIAGNPLEINPADAQRIGVKSDDHVRVRSRTGEIVVPVSVSDAVPAGVVSMQFGFAAAKRATGGAARETMNVLVDAKEGCDELTGMPTLNGIPVSRRLAIPPRRYTICERKYF
jgi:anaerobic selenocysteine-containing dehydrogenase